MTCEALLVSAAAIGRAWTPEASQARRKVIALAKLNRALVATFWLSLPVHCKTLLHGAEQVWERNVPLERASVHGAAPTSTAVHAHRRAEPSSSDHRLVQHTCGSTTCKCLPLGPLPSRDSGGAGFTRAGHFLWPDCVRSTAG